MKRIVLCCDGTWNTADQETNGAPCPSNVVRLAYHVAKHDPNGTLQITYYDQGVGTANAMDRVVGGALGRGLEANIHDSYRFLVANYEPGDELYLFGFSRGAFTARSISGMIRKCGILRRGRVDQYVAARKFYHSTDRPGSEAVNKFRRENSVEPERDIEVKFIGVWDTVGALGLPVGMVGKEKYEFHDTELSGTVRNAYHALAIDERRRAFAPSLWDYKPKDGQTVEQRWFPGVHSDVGGGYAERKISDIALKWMLEKARGAGLALDEDVLKTYPCQPDPLADLHDSRGVMYRFRPALDRPIGMPTKDSKNAGPNGLDPTQTVDESAIQRWDKIPDYRPPQLREYFKKIKDPRGV